VLATAGGSAAQALTVADWGEVTFFADLSELSEEQRDVLERRGVRLEARVVTAIDGSLDGPLRVRLAGGDEVRMKALFLLSHHKPSPLASGLDCALDETPHGPLVRTDAGKLTSVPGVYAAGDTARLPSNITLAAADGVLAGAAIHAALIADAVERAV
jgi:thioredoxin reductase